MYDYLVVGSGLFGSIFAHEARKTGKSVLVVDKRPHIGGNCYTENREGVDVHTYGPHIFHTSDEKIWKYVNQFATFNHYVNRPKVNYKGKVYSFPINLMTLQQLWGVTTPEEASCKLEEVRVPCANPRNLEEWILSQVGREVYETFIRGYTMKQWKRDPKDLPSFIIKRLPIRLTYDDNYFDDSYQGIPIGGYTKIFEEMLQGVDVALGEDFFANRQRWESRAKSIVFTGKIDEYFGYSHGELDYRTLSFEHHTQPGDYQGVAVMNYTEAEIPYTRITEHKHFQVQDVHKIKNTVWTKEYPAEWNRDAVPYYPINDEKNNAIYSQYKEMAKGESNVIFGGRLAEYKYYDMHQVVGSALQKSRRALND